MSASKTVLITGATSGIGFELAKRLAADDAYRVIATGRNAKALEELRTLGIEGYCADLRDPKQLDWLVSCIGTPDLIVFSAGVGKFHLAHETTDEETEAMLETNVLVPMQLTARMVPAMMKRRQGHLLYIGSQAGKVATPKTSVYAATKHALIGYTNALRMEVAPYDVHVSVVHPGPIDTPFIELADATGGYKQAMGSQLLSIETVVQSVIETIMRPRREVNLPKITGLTSKLYALAPSAVETIGRPFFYKK
ncbi:oxidoreductase [Sporosarcina sp. P37]|uniref:SDR family NAD(P)-dependent oxidoreductase n=1 Tax=unclassified Sporosarcina TaxID=2647733 RepID=UPI0009C02AB1|nr:MULTISPECIES: SDR family NAD(P)-dependent oxidoreductase [unclassified Sporosarcina]ARD46871.1 oxidoreductase [Sporosarcina sp. P33]ARK23396.1 oxidoreductase [Sporosarcina sp. P37]PID19652.1 oxidoreductase [Sporosarcina sp. P35]